MIDPKPGNPVDPTDMTPAPDVADSVDESTSELNLEAEEQAARLGDFA